MKLEDLKGFFDPKPFYDSTIFTQKKKKVFMQEQIIATFFFKLLRNNNKKKPTPKQAEKKMLAMKLSSISQNQHSG